MIVYLLPLILFCLTINCYASAITEFNNLWDGLSVLVSSVTKTVEPGIVYVEIIPPAATEQFRTKSSRSAIPTRMTGIVLKKEGIILLPLLIKKGDTEKIKVYVNQDEYLASVNQVDEMLGLSLLKIQPTYPLPPLLFGDSDNVKLADCLLTLTALGKEFNYQKLSSLGFVSGRVPTRTYQRIALGDTIKPRPNSDYGMPVVNLSGEVVGVIVAGTVVAINDIKQVVDRLLNQFTTGTEDTGEIEDQQPWLGIAYDELNEDYAASLGITNVGILVIRVFNDAPAGKAGIQVNDIILGVDDIRISGKGPESISQFRRILNPRIGRKVRLNVYRTHTKQAITLDIVFTKKPKPQEFNADDLGLVVQEIKDMDFYDYNLFTRRGVLVTDILYGSPAATGSTLYEKLISPGDVVVELAGQPTLTVNDFIRAVNYVRQHKLTSILLKLYRANRTTYVALNLSIGQKTK